MARQKRHVSARVRKCDINQLVSVPKKPLTDKEREKLEAKASRMLGYPVKVKSQV